MNPGYDWKNHADFRRKITMECTFCHNAYPATKRDTDRADMEAVFPEAIPEGIDCQRCHGPGAEHARSPQVSNIVNPGRLSPERNLEVCMQCHLETTSAPLPYAVRRLDRGVFSYKPGEPLSEYMLHFDHAAGSGHDDKFEIASAAYRFRKSLCFQKSEAMTCTTCHNPHNVPRGNDATAHYVSVCESCHQGVVTKLRESGKHPSSRDCLGCHMPKRRTDDVVHAVMTDHYIQRKRPARDLLAPLQENHDPGVNLYKGPVALYYPPSPPDAASELYVALAQVTQKSNLAAGVHALKAAIETHRPAAGGFYYELAKAYAESNEQDTAIEMYRAALERQPDYWPALHRLGLSYLGKGMLDQSLSFLTRASLASTEATVLNDLGLLFRRLGKNPEAAETLKRAIALDGGFAQAYNNLGGMFLDAGDMKSAEENFREAIRLQPDLAATHANLARILMRRNDSRQARYHFERAIREAEPGESAAFEAHMALGNMDELEGNLAGAAAHYRTAIGLSPEPSRAHFSLGAVLTMQGKRPEASTHFQKASESPDPETRQSALDHLRRLK
jgi:predicted CXXCH cytochrome family protein